MQAELGVRGKFSAGAAWAGRLVWVGSHKGNFLSAEQRGWMERGPAEAFGAACLKRRLDPTLISTRFI